MQIYLPHRRAQFRGGGGSVVSTTDLVSFWKLDEASGTRYDSFGSNDLTDNNTVGQGTSITDGPYSTVADFVHANSEYLSKSHNSGLSPTGSMTLTGWFKIDSYSGEALTWLMGKHDLGNYPTSAPDIETSIYVTSQGVVAIQKWYGAVGNSFVGLTTSQNKITLGTWFFLAVYCDVDNDEIGLVVNTDTPLTASFTQTPQTGTGPFLIGERYYNGSPENLYYFDGMVSAVGYWNRKLTDAEITALANKDDPFYDQF